MINKNRSKLQLSAIPFLALGVVFSGSSYFLLGFLDSVVHGDLYSHGLVFSYEWASNYWAYSDLLRTFFVASIIFAIIAIITIIIQIASHKTSIKYISSSFLLINIFFMLFCFVLLTRIDFIVNNTLYNFGLQFSYDWAGQFWTNLIFIYSTFLASILIYCLSIGLLLISNSFYESRFFGIVKSLFRINSILFFSGIIILYFSISFNSSILSFVGLGLVFWGAILFYTRSDSYVNENLLFSSINHALSSFEELITELGYSGPGIYLPPKYLKDFDSSKLFISMSQNMILPSVDQTQSSDSIIIKKPQGLFLTPVGYDLSKLFEETIGVSFIQMDISDVEIYIRKLLVETLEIVQNVQVQVKDNIIHFKLEKSIFKNLGTLSSALGCVLAKSSGKPIIIIEKTLDEDEKISDFYYQIIED